MGDAWVEPKWSNCFLEAIKEYIQAPTKIKIHKKGSWLEIFQGRWPHFYWFDFRYDKFFHFAAKDTGRPFLKQLWFRGTINRFINF